MLDNWFNISFYVIRR